MITLRPLPSLKQKRFQKYSNMEIKAFTRPVFKRSRGKLWHKLSMEMAYVFKFEGKNWRFYFSMSKPSYYYQCQKSWYFPSTGYCCLCGSCQETVDHVLSSCSVIAQSCYKTHLDAVVRIIHWELARKGNLKAKQNWLLDSRFKVFKTVCGQAVIFHYSVWLKSWENSSKNLINTIMKIIKKNL